MTPYTCLNDADNVRIKVEGDEPSWVAYPGSFMHHVTIQVEI